MPFIPGFRRLIAHIRRIQTKIRMCFMRNLQKISWSDLNVFPHKSGGKFTTNEEFKLVTSSHLHVR